jgi:glycosyltransferase involved in cell wall biosynthesis
VLAEAELVRNFPAAQSVATRATTCSSRGVRSFTPKAFTIRNEGIWVTPSILWELKKHGVPVIYHLNDFKLLCPSYNMVAHGHACEKCSGGKFWHVAAEDCYTRGRSYALVLAAEAYVHKWFRTYERCVTRFLAPSQFVKHKLIANGWEAKKIDVLPHFQKLPAEAPPPNADAPILYFGRLSAEKGVA